MPFKGVKMQKTEVTVQVLNSLEETVSILSKNGFELIEKWTLNDYYFSKFNKKQLKNMNFSEIMSNSLLLRQCIGNQNQQQFIYKKKEFDTDENVVSEEKFSVEIDDIEKARKILSRAGLTEWCKITDKNRLYKKEDFEIDLQVVDNLGIFIEFEENESMKDLNSLEKREKMISMLKTLELNLGDDFSCKKAYLKFKSEN